MLSGKKNAAKVAGLLATIYPAMFKFEEKDSLKLNMDWVELRV